MKNDKVLEGVFTLLFTPFSADGKTFDPQGMQRQIDYVLESGVNGVVACGKAGEFEGMVLGEIEQVLTTVLEQVNGRVPVGMGIISVEQEQGLQAAETAARCGADFAMVKKLSSKDVRCFYRDLAEQIPVMLYDTTDDGPLDVTAHILPLLQECEGIVAVKVSTNIGSFPLLKREAPDTPFLCGTDIFTLLTYQTGSDGVVAGSAAFMPEHEVTLHQLVQQARWEEARGLFYERMLPFVAFATPDPFAFSIGKYLLHWKGIIDSPIVRPPYVNAPDWLHKEMHVLARRLGLVDR